MLAARGEQKERTNPIEEFEAGYSYIARCMWGCREDNLDTSDITSAFAYMRSFRENVNKYVYAARCSRDKLKVLDVPCGLGYGTAILGANGNTVIGIDNDPEALSNAISSYRYSNVSFRYGDMTDESIYDSDIDCIVCMDGLEHVSGGEDLLSLFYNALPHGGLLVVTAPVSKNLDLSKRKNKYHLEDYDYDKFKVLILGLFEDVDFYGIDTYGNIQEPRAAFTQYMAVCRK